MAKKKKSKFGIRATEADLGLRAIVADNSFIHLPGVTDTKYFGDVSLAGKEVTIESGPFSLKFKMPVHHAKPIEKEFITVKHGPHLFNILNCFKSINGKNAEGTV